MLDLLERQTKLTANQWKIAGAATLGDMLDFFDFFLIGFVLAFVVKEWNLTYGQSGAILLASGVSAIAAVASETFSTAVISAVRRPILSAIQPYISEPNGALTPEASRIAPDWP